MGTADLYGSSDPFQRMPKAGTGSHPTVLDYLLRNRGGGEGGVRDKTSKREGRMESVVFF